MREGLKRLGAIALGYTIAKLLSPSEEKELKPFLDNYYKNHRSEYLTPQNFIDKLIEITKTYE